MVEINESTIAKKYGLNFSLSWTPDLLTLLDSACNDLITILGGTKPSWMDGLQIRLETIPFGGLTSRGLVHLNPQGLTHWTIVHELAHAWDLSTGQKLSRKLRRHTRSWGPLYLLKHYFPSDSRFWYHVGSMPPPCGTDQNFNRLEDFAESLTAYVYPDEAKVRAAKRGMPYDQYGYEDFRATPRGQFISRLIASNKNALG
jgi:hypothetical protein